jgi:hypothetical protein
MATNADNSIINSRCNNAASFSQPVEISSKIESSTNVEVDVHESNLVGDSPPLVVFKSNVVIASTDISKMQTIDGCEESLHSVLDTKLSAVFVEGDYDTDAPDVGVEGDCNCDKDAPYVGVGVEGGCDTDAPDVGVKGDCNGYTDVPDIRVEGDCNCDKDAPYVGVGVDSDFKEHTEDEMSCRICKVCSFCSMYVMLLSVVLWLCVFR